MNKLYQYLLAAIMMVGSIMLISCNHSTKRMVTDFSSGVVLVQNIGYYSVTLGDDNTFYFSDYDEEHGIVNLEVDKDSIQPSHSYGTGFFISEDGRIATNRHVVSGKVKEKEIQKSLSNLFSQLKNAFKSLKSDYTEEYNAAELLRQKYMLDGDLANAELAAAYRNSKAEQIEEINQFLDAIDELDPRSAELEYHNEVSIAYDNTYVNRPEHFIPCTIRKVSTDEDIDLAVIQLNDKTTPQGKAVFEVPNKNMLEHYSFTEYIARLLGADKNESLLLIGYNLGPLMALTDDGVKSQHVEGKISRDEDFRIMYTIPTLNGSSGSPIFNRRGQLVAVNYAGMSNTQSFNFGIKAIRLYSFLNQ